MTTNQYRISPDNPLVIEQRLSSPNYSWGFYKVCDGKPDAKRIVQVLNGKKDAKHGDLWEQQPQ